jgi:O-antigen/teichoic acid export membrane protein
VLTIDGIGTYSYTSSVQNYFLLLAALGTTTYGAREISRVRDCKKDYTRLFWEIEILTIITTSICIIAWIAFSVLSTEYRVYYFLLLPALIAIMFDISWLFNGLEKMPIIVSRNVLVRVIGIILIFVTVKTKEDLALYFIIQSATSLIANLLMWLELPKILEKTDLRKINPFKHLKPTLMYFIPTIASSVYLVLDKVLIGVLTKDVAENGYYTQAERIISILKNVVFMALNSVVGVRISYLYKEKKIVEIKQRIEYSFNYLAFMGFGCVFGIWAVADLFVPVFYGPGYEKSIIVLILFAPILIFTSISSSLNAQYFVPVGRRAECTKYIIAGALVNITLNLLLIPRFKSCGAVIASVVAECVIAVLFWINCDKIITLKTIWKVAWKKILSGIVMLALIRLYNRIIPEYNSILLLLTDIIIGIVGYVITLILCRDVWIITILNSMLCKFKIKKI